MLASICSMIIPTEYLLNREIPQNKLSWIIYYISGPISWIFEAILEEEHAADVLLCLPAALDTRKGRALRALTRAKVKFENNRHRVLIARPASMPSAGAAPIVSCFDNGQPDNDSQAIDAVSGLYNERVGTQMTLSCIAHARGSWIRKSIAQLHRLCQWQSSHWSCDFSTHGFWGKGRVDGLHFSLYIPRGKEGLDDFRWSVAHTGLDPTPLSWLDMINEKHSHSYHESSIISSICLYSGVCMIEVQDNIRKATAIGLTLPYARWGWQHTELDNDGCLPSWWSKYAL